MEYRELGGVLNASMIKQMMVDFQRKNKSVTKPINISGEEVETTFT